MMDKDNANAVLADLVLWLEQDETNVDKLRASAPHLVAKLAAWVTPENPRTVAWIGEAIRSTLQHEVMLGFRITDREAKAAAIAAIKWLRQYRSKVNTP